MSLPSSTRHADLLVVVALLTAFTGTASAQQSTARDTATTNRLDTVQVTAHDAGAAGDAASAGHVAPQTIADRPLLRPGEVMEEVPGMIVTQHSGGGKANQYFLRGFNLDHGTDFETTLDGMPVNMPSHAHGQGYTDLNFIIPELVAGIDYAKGPYGAAQGDFATAGSAAIHYAPAAMPGRAELTGGSDGYARAVVTGAPRVGSGTLVYGVEGDRINGPWVHPDDYRKAIGVVRYAKPLGGGAWAVTAMGYDGRWSASDQIPERAYADGAIARFGTVDPSDGGTSSRYSLSANLGLPVLGGSLQTAAYGIRYALDLYSNFTYFLDDPVHGDQIEQYDQRTVIGWNGSWTKPAAPFGLHMSNTIGWDVRRDRVAPSGLYHTEQRVRLSTVIEDRLTETGAGLYVENQTQWAPWLRSIAGFRVQRVGFDVASNLAPNSGSGAASLGLPKVSLVFGPWRGAELFVNAGEGFHSNDVRGATEHVDPSSGAAVDPVTPLVRAAGAELGVRASPVAGWRTSLSLWSLHLGSELVFDGDAGTTVPGRPSMRYGIEWSNQYGPRPWLQLHLDLAATRARFTDTDPVGRYIPEALDATAAAGVTVRRLGPWTASVFVRYFGPRALIESDSVSSPSTTLIDAQGSWRITPHLGLRMDVFNIANHAADDITYFYTSRLPGEPTAGVADLHFHPVERRSLRLGVWMTF